MPSGKKHIGAWWMELEVRLPLIMIFSSNIFVHQKENLRLICASATANSSHPGYTRVLANATLIGESTVEHSALLTKESAGMKFISLVWRAMAMPLALLVLGQEKLRHL